MELNPAKPAGTVKMSFMYVSTDVLSLSMLLVESSRVKMNLNAAGPTYQGNIFLQTLLQYPGSRNSHLGIRL